jgi:hypothetical protein
MPEKVFAERRRQPRYPSDGLMVYVRRKGRFGQLEGLAVDFNRHGLALIIDQPLPKESLVFLALTSGETKVTDVLGVVHNCCSNPGGYRCGIQFRTSSDLQMDRAQVEQALCILEARFKTSCSVRDEEASLQSG